MLRKLSASIFLLVMSLLVALHSSAIGYCVNQELYFVGDHVETPEVCSHDCDGDQKPVEQQDPVDHQHLMVSLDAVDFQWSATLLCVVPQFVEIELPDWSLPILLMVGEQVRDAISPTNPPPPDLPIFRRDAALRI